MSRYIDIHTHRLPSAYRTPKAEGRHPWDAESNEDIVISQEAEVVGEIGLDYVCHTNRERQEIIFCKQLEIAEQRGLPVVLHSVKAFEKIMKILDKYSLSNVIFHGFIGSPEQALQALSKGYYLSFGERCAKSPKTIEALRITPLNKIFIETDESATPIEQIYNTIALLKGIPVEILIEEINKNYNRIFNYNER